ncbi:MAG TPA: MFS transporter [Steroidobacteraceae bacterium]|nr:MFS transporter [Steroidobacteraceae bacterium]
MRWYKNLDANGRAAFKASFLGWGLDALNYMVYTFAIAALINVFHIDRGQAGILGTITLLTSAVGGWGAGILADKYGRVRVLQATILWFTVTTAAIGFAHSFGQIFWLRALQGLGFGGEWAVGSVLMGEIITTSLDRGKAVGTVQSAWALGWGLAAIMYTLLFSLLPENYAWRALFWIGLLPALLVLYIRKNLHEPEVFSKTRAERAVSGVRTSPWIIFSPKLLRVTTLASLMCVGCQGGYYAVTTWLPTYLKTTRHLSVLNTGGYLMVVIAGAFCGYLVGAYLTDRLGRRANLILFSVLSGISLMLYTEVPLSNGAMLVMGFPLGFAASGIFSGVGAYLTELYPTDARANGQGFTYNFGRGIGALFPTLVGYLSQGMGLGAAIAVFAGGAYVLVLVSTLSLPETKGRELRAISV